MYVLIFAYRRLHIKIKSSSRDATWLNMHAYKYQVKQVKYIYMYKLCQTWFFQALGVMHAYCLKIRSHIHVKPCNFLIQRVVSNELLFFVIYVFNISSSTNYKSCTCIGKVYIMCLGMYHVCMFGSVRKLRYARRRGARVQRLCVVLQSYTYFGVSVRLSVRPSVRA